MPIYAYECPGGHIHEALVGMGTASHRCNCGQEAQQVSLFGASVIAERAAVPYAQQRYDIRTVQEAMAEREYLHTRAEEHVGQALPSPNLWKMAKRQAALVRRGLAPPPKWTPKT